MRTGGKWKCIRDIYLLFPSSKHFCWCQCWGLWPPRWLRPAQWFLSAVIEVMEHIYTSAVSPDWTLAPSQSWCPRSPRSVACCGARRWRRRRSWGWWASPGPIRGQYCGYVDQLEVSIVVMLTNQSEVSTSITCAGRNFTCLRLISLSSRWPLSSTPGHRMLRCCQ